MPLSRGTTIAEPGDGGGGDSGGGFVPSLPEVGEYEPWWVAPDGTVLPLNPPGADFFTLKSVAGLGATPVDVRTEAAADGGVTVESIRNKERTIAWPLRIRGDTHMEFLARWRDAVELFTQTKRLDAPGQLVIRRPDGTQRTAVCWYSGGLDQEPEEGAWKQVTPVVSLLVPDGYWQAVDPVTRTWSQETPPDFLSPTFPAVSSGAVIGAATLRNDGVQDSWPTWTIRGPMTSLTATNVTRGETFVLTYALAAGQTLTMTTRPIQVRGPGGVQAINALNLLAGGKPWRVGAKSVTDIQFTAAGSAPPTTPGGSDGTSITASFYEKFETS